jgi:release factor glutamine methyltransferase
MAAPDLRTALASKVVADAAARLRDAGSPSARLDAELLVAHALGRERAWLIAHPEATLEPDAAAAVAGWVERRASGEPVAYLRGHKEWFSLRVTTDARALIPRPETELLAESAIAEIADRLTRDDAHVVAWDAATGGGALALALALRFRAALALGRLELVASDLSPDALELAAENLALHGVADLVSLACADLLEPAGTSLPAPDVVVVNPPYLTTAEVDRGSGSIAHEPRMALDGGLDGLEVIRRLLSDLRSRAAPGATVLLEIGDGQADAVSAMVPEGASVMTEVDLGGVERVVRIDMP